MKRTFVALVAVLGLLAAGLLRAEAERPATKQFLGILHLTPRLYADAAWTGADKQAVSDHFARLQAAARERKVIFAGRTLEGGEKTIGLVVFEAADLQEAERFMTQDPAVVAGVMTFDVHPYLIAVSRYEPAVPETPARHPGSTQ